MFFFAFFQVTPLYLCHLLSFSPLIRPPFALLYIVLAISQSTNDSYSSINGGDCVPVGDGELKLSECRNAFLSLSLFILLCLPYVFIPSLSHFIFPAPPLPLCLRRLAGWLRAEWSTSLCLQQPMLTELSTLLQTTSPVFTSLLCTLSILCQPTQQWPWLGKLKGLAAEEKPEASSIKTYQALESIVLTQP